MCSFLYYLVVLFTCINLTIAEDDTATPEPFESEFFVSLDNVPAELPEQPDVQPLPDEESEPEPNPDLSTITEVPVGLGFNPQVRIVGGDIAPDRSRFAYQASMRQVKANFHFCGATIVHASHVLTAAHCVYDNLNLAPVSSLSVVVGDLNTRRELDSTVYRTVSGIFPHPEYSHVTFQNDIAILRLSQPLDGWTTFINLLPLASSTPPDNMSCVVSGWGTTSSDGPASDDLRFVAVPIVSRRTCMARYGNTIMDGMLCAGFMEGGRDACQGDSGGPLVCNNELSGVVSWGYGCAAAGFPGIYSDVAFYKTWVEEQIARPHEAEEEIVPPLDESPDDYGSVDNIMEERKPNSQQSNAPFCTLILAIFSFIALT